MTGFLVTPLHHFCAVCVCVYADLGTPSQVVIGSLNTLCTKSAVLCRGGGKGFPPVGLSSGFLAPFQFQRHSQTLNSLAADELAPVLSVS